MTGTYRVVMRGAATTPGAPLTTVGATTGAGHLTWYSTPAWRALTHTTGTGHLTARTTTDTGTARDVDVLTIREHQRTVSVLYRGRAVTITERHTT